MKRYSVHYNGTACGIYDAVNRKAARQQAAIDMAKREGKGREQSPEAIRCLMGLMRAHDVAPEAASKGAMRWRDASTSKPPPFWTVLVWVTASPSFHTGEDYIDVATWDDVKQRWRAFGGQDKWGQGYDETITVSHYIDVLTPQGKKREGETPEHAARKCSE